VVSVDKAGVGQVGAGQVGAGQVRCWSGGRLRITQVRLRWLDSKPIHEYGIQINSVII